jgi:hypothetical protein
MRRKFSGLIHIYLGGCVPTLTNWLQKILDCDYKIHTDLDEYCALSEKNKLALIHGLDFKHDLKTQIKRISEASNLVFVIESQLHNHYIDLLKTFSGQSIFWVVPGFLNQSANSNLIFWGHWFDRLKELYHALPKQLEQFKSHDIKEQSFEALLGKKKPHRDFVYRSVKNNHLMDEFIIRYAGEENVSNFYAPDYFIWEPNLIEVEPDVPLIGSSKLFYYHGMATELCSIIPTQVYRNTAYSIVAETNYNNAYTFFTEKTAKPLIGKRLFVVFSGCKFLHNLRKLGFKTFDTVIDESYDTIEDQNDRFTQAFEQVKKLCEMDQEKILQDIKPIVEHNFEIIMRTDWKDKVFKDIHSTLHKYDLQSSI